MTPYSLIRNSQRSKSKPWRKRRTTSPWILQCWCQGWSTHQHSSRTVLILRTMLFSLFWLKHELGDWAEHCIHAKMLLGFPSVGEKEDVSVSWTKLSLFLKGEGKINGYLYFVETQSILCGSYPLNGDEGTIMEYGHFTVTADSRCWPVVEVFVLDL